MQQVALLCASVCVCGLFVLCGCEWTKYKCGVSVQQVALWCVSVCVDIVWL